VTNVCPAFDHPVMDPQLEPQSDRPIANHQIYIDYGHRRPASAPGEGSLTLARGDVTRPFMRQYRSVVIPHVCNNANAWGAGFTGSLSRRWKAPEEVYRRQCRECLTNLSDVQFVRVEESPNQVTVANMIAQHGINGAILGRGRSWMGCDPCDAMQPNWRRPQLRYAALVDCMRSVASFCRISRSEIYCPKFGSNLAGGSWHVITTLIAELWCDEGINVTVFEYETDERKWGISGFLTI
jgi:hypothetical protein